MLGTGLSAICQENYDFLTVRNLSMKGGQFFKCLKSPNTDSLRELGGYSWTTSVAYRDRMIDLFGRKIELRRISVTDRCNLGAILYALCVLIRKHDYILTIEQLSTVADALYALGVIKMRITGGEPLIRGGVMHLMEHIGSNKDVELVVTTNGTNLDRAMAEQLKRVGVRRVNLSLDTLNPQTFRLLTGGDINQV